MSLPNKSLKAIMLISDPFSNDKRAFPEALALRENGHIIEALGWDRQQRYSKSETIKGIKIERFQLKSKYGLGLFQIFKLPRFWFWVFNKLIIRDFDVIHCHDFDTLPIGFLIAKLKRKTIIYDSHESFPDTVYKKSKILYSLVLWLEKVIIKHVDHVITVGDILASALTSRGAKKVKLVGNWKDENSYCVDDQEIIKLKQDMSIKEKIVICYLGMLDHIRKIMPLIEVVKQDRDVCLLLGGNGIHKLEIEAAISGMPNVRYLKEISQEEAAKYTMLSDVIYCCFGRNYRNARFSAATRLFDSFAAGKAIIVTKGVGDVGRIVAEEKCGVLVENPDRTNIQAAIEILKCKKTLDLFKNNAKAAYHKKYNWANAKRELLNVYDEINNSV